MSECLSCASPLSALNRKYCSNVCQGDYSYSQYIIAWKKGECSGNRGIRAKNISNHIRRYLLVKYGSACVNCGWNMKHPITGNVPLEVDHIDGNYENNSEDNLRLLCPNCHSLTTNFRNLNKGNGRKWRSIAHGQDTRRLSSVG